MFLCQVALACAQAGGRTNLPGPVHYVLELILLRFHKLGRQNRSARVWRQDVSRQLPYASAVAYLFSGTCGASDESRDASCRLSAVPALGRLSLSRKRASVQKLDAKSSAGSDFNYHKIALSDLANISCQTRSELGAAALPSTYTCSAFHTKAFSYKTAPYSLRFDCTAQRPDGNEATAVFVFCLDAQVAVYCDIEAMVEAVCGPSVSGRVGTAAGCAALRELLAKPRQAISPCCQTAGGGQERGKIISKAGGGVRG